MEYGQVKTLRLPNAIWVALQRIFEGDGHAKKDRLKS